MQIAKAFPSKYLKADDLEGREHNVVIKSVVMEDIKSQDGPDVTKPVMYFEKGTKGLVLNLTNASACTLAFGSGDTDDWLGQEICLFPDKTTFGRQIVPCIRMRGASNPARQIEQEKQTSQPWPGPDPDSDLDDTVPW